MIGLKKRMELIERLHGLKGRLIIVRADTEDDVVQAFIASPVKRCPSDTVIKLRRSALNMPAVMSVHDEGAEAFFASLDGQSLPLVREAA